MIAIGIITIVGLSIIHEKRLDIIEIMIYGRKLHK